MLCSFQVYKKVNELYIYIYPHLKKILFPYKQCSMCSIEVLISYPFYRLVQFSSLQLLSRVQLFAIPWTTARQASLSITNSWSSPNLMSLESVMPSNHLILCCPLLLPPSTFPNIRIFSNKSVLHIRWKVLQFQLQHQSF